VVHAPGGIPVSLAAMEGVPAAGAGSEGLSAALLTWRARQGLSRIAAARRLGVAPTTLRGWELLGVRPQPVNLPRLAGVLHVDVERVRELTGPDRVRTVSTSGGTGASPLCRARLAAGLTMTQLALKLGVVPSAVSRWENGVRAPAPAIRPRLATALRLDPALVDVVLDGSPRRRAEGVQLPGLGRLRRERGLTQRAFCTALGIGPTTAASWEHGRVRVPADRLDDVASVLGVDREVLLRSGSESPQPRSGERPLTELRKAARMTQRELALHLGRSGRTVAHWEAGTRPVPVSVARPLARVLRQPLPRVLTAAGLVPVGVPSPRTWRPEDLPQVLTALRRASGWSAAALGRQVGMSGRIVRSWEVGSRLPPPAACQRLELAHGMPRGCLTSLRRAHPLAGALRRPTPAPNPRAVP
jgi:transcriptional regulator with XRE-family HTH domain